ncbi:MAG: Y-family DNA polymerase [Enterococcus lacertideformus]|uniref:Y-family DNA polymerase n=1 Tax=Enterococcus lacertideformus TaxID=2771493 RepID=A0A931AT66_9ENTE|nr:Y-family DNA polymerase [Enterococcus lacertideformus]
MLKNQNPKFDYAREPSRDILCIDCKSFYASVECVARGLDPLAAKLVVMSYPSDNTKERGSGLILASSPAAKKAYGITNISRARDLPFPYPKDLHIVPPRMAYYMKKNQQINNIYQTYTDETNHHVYSVDESFLDITNSLKLFQVKNAWELAKLICKDVYQQTGIYTTVGIGDNPLLAKLALANGSKNNEDRIAEWRYEDVPKKIWTISPLTDFWGIGHRTARRLKYMGITSIYDLAHADYYRLKENMGTIGTQLFAHAWGIDRSFLGEKYIPKSKSIGNSQILNRDYTRREEVEIVIKEMADQVGTRLRREHAKAQVVSLQIGFSLGYTDSQGKTGFHQQLKVEATNSSQKLASILLTLFNNHYRYQDIRSIGVSCSHLIYTDSLQLNLFDDSEEQVDSAKINFVVDKIRQKYGFKSIVHAHSLLEGGRAIARSSLVGGHTGGLAGIEGESHASNKKRIP